MRARPPRDLAALLLLLTACGFREIPREPACFEYIVASDSHSCGRRTDGSMWCWGSNTNGQLGTGDTEPRSGIVPVDPEGLGNEVVGVYVPTGGGVISTRTAFTCARKSDGTLWCWGNNEYGQLGTGDREPRLVPTQVDPFGLGASVHAASLGSGFGCARKTDNSLWCWGANESGQLGTGDRDDRATPVQIDPDGLGARVRRLATGVAHTCARTTDAAVYCWGSNANGELGVGVGDGSPRLAPTLVESATITGKADVLVAGASHSCVSLSDARVYCWGSNQYGQLGLGADPAARLTPTRVDLPDFAGGVPLFTAGARHTCAGKTDGSAWCWGDNRAGQLGNGSRGMSAAPTPVDSSELGAHVAVLYAGGTHTCARNLDNSVWCWGSNESGQLGVDVGPSRDVPTQVSPVCP